MSGEARPALVFLHGIGGGAAAFDPVVERLRAQGWQALAWDQPGYGGRAPVEPYTFAEVARALDAWLDECGVGRCVLVGHSMGGMVALEYYAAFCDGAAAPCRVAGLVLAHTSPAFGNPDGEFQRRFVESRTRPLDDGRTMADVAAGLVPGLVAKAAGPEARAFAASVMSRVPAATYRLVVQELVRFDRRALLPRISVPVLCLAAAEDATASPAVLEKMAQKIPGARYECLDGVGHLAPMENPDLFAACVARFAAGVTAASNEPRTVR